MDGIGRIGAVATLSLRGSLRGPRALALAGLAAVPTLVVVALVAAGTAPDTLSSATQALFLALTLPIVLVVVTLVPFVGQFRTEIDDDTLAYLSSRSIPRWQIVLGKYLGALGGALALLLPASLVPFLVAAAAGAPALPGGALASVVLLTVLATAAYGAFFLFLGMATPSALLVGLLYGFLWEELLVFLPGSVPRLTVKFYLLSLASDLTTSGPLSGYPNAVTTLGAVAAPVLAAVAALLLAMGAITTLELIPRRTSA